MQLNVDILYPIGSIYMNINEVDPGVLFGGTWVRIQDTFLLACGTTYLPNTTGGSAKHTHNYGFQYGGYYRSASIESNAHAGVLKYDSNNNITITGAGSSVGSFTAPINNAAATAAKDVSMGHYRMTSNTSYTSTLPPYTTVYVWRREA